MTRLLLIAVLAISAQKKKAAKPALKPGADLSSWADNHPEAVQSFGEWVRENQSAAHALVAFDEHNKKTAKSRLFLVWALEQRGQASGEFAAQHADWKDFAELSGREGLGLDRLVRWCRDHPKAAEELEPAPAPFAWLGKHLFAEQLKAAQPQ